MCICSVWTQPPYTGKNALLFFIPQKPKQSQLSSHFDFVVKNQRFLHPQYHDWGKTLEQGTEPLTAPRTP